MVHIHTKPGQHDHTVSMFIVRTDEAEPKIMFHLHKKYGVYMQFGGHIELDENPSQTLPRELKEETGYDISQLKILQPKNAIKNLSGIITHPVPVAYSTHPVWGYDHSHTDTAFSFVADQKPKHNLEAEESDDIRLFTKKELLGLPAEKTYENGREIALYILDHVLKEWEQIPASSIW